MNDSSNSDRIWWNPDAPLPEEDFDEIEEVEDFALFGIEPAEDREYGQIAGSCGCEGHALTHGTCHPMEVPEGWRVEVGPVKVPDRWGHPSGYRWEVLISRPK